MNMAIISRKVMRTPVFNFFEETKNIEIGGVINNVIKDIDDF
jgi:hypothetical protein